MSRTPSDLLLHRRAVEGPRGLTERQNSRGLITEELRRRYDGTFTWRTRGLQMRKHMCRVDLFLFLGVHGIDLCYTCMRTPHHSHVVYRKLIAS